MSYRRYDIQDDVDADIYYISEEEYQTRKQASRRSTEPRAYVIVEEYVEIGPSTSRRTSTTTRGKGRETYRDFESTTHEYSSDLKDSYGNTRSSRSIDHRNGESSSRSSRPSASYDGEDFSRSGARRFASNPDVPHRHADHHAHSGDFCSTDYDVPKYQRTRSECHRKPAFFCWPCNKSFASAEEKFDHRLNSSRHFLCRLCNDDVDHKGASDRELHYRESHQSQFCEFCAKLFATDSACLYHMDNHHSFCEPCGIYFVDREERRQHWARSREHCKEYCTHCGEIFPDLIAHVNRKHARRHERTPEEHTNRTRGNGHDSYRGEQTPREEPHRSSSTRHTGVHYITLGVSPSAHQDEIKRAAKKRRVETHPDRLKRKPGLSQRQKASIDEEAAKVGYAADILSDPVSRMRYDQKVRAGRAE